MDRCKKDNEGNWNLNDVFIEASRITSFSSAKKGKHYNKGFGFVKKKENQQDKSAKASKPPLSKKEHDTLLRKLKNTVRGYPFCTKASYGTDRHRQHYSYQMNRHFMDRFERENEYDYRVEEVTRGDPNSIWYLKKVFYEAAIDHPEYFEGYTHYGKFSGFIEASQQNEFELFIQYVRMIDKPMTRNEERSWNHPHPKWYEFRKRVDEATLNKENQWELESVFKEAATKLTFLKGMKGMHYKDGFGLTMTTQNTATI